MNIAESGYSPALVIVDDRRVTIIPLTDANELIVRYCTYYRFSCTILHGYEICM